METCSHYKNDDGSLDAVNYKGKMTADTNIVTKKYVDDKVASNGGGVPVGSIMIWMNSSAQPVGSNCKAVVLMSVDIHNCTLTCKIPADIQAAHYQAGLDIIPVNTVIT